MATEHLPLPRVHTTKTVEEQTVIDLSPALIRAMLRKAYPQLLKDVHPEDIAIQFQVPSGGDYCGDLLDVEEEYQLTARFTRKVTTNG